MIFAFTEPSSGFSIAVVGAALYSNRYPNLCQPPEASIGFVSKHAMIHTTNYLILVFPVIRLRNFRYVFLVVAWATVVLVAAGICPSVDACWVHLLPEVQSVSGVFVCLVFLLMKKLLSSDRRSDKVHEKHIKQKQEQCHWKGVCRQLPGITRADPGPGPFLFVIK